MQIIKRSLLTSTILALTLIGAHVQTAQAATITRTASAFTAVSTASSCDVVRAVITDGNDMEISRGSAINIAVGTSVTNLNPSFSLPLGTYDLPIKIGWVDVGTNSDK